MSRVLVVAAPMTARGGVYAYLETLLPALRRRGWDTGIVWALRAPGGRLDAEWESRVLEAPARAARMRALVREVRRGVREWHPDVVLSVLPQSDVACAVGVAATRTPWVAMVHGRPFPSADEAPLRRRAPWREAVRRSYRRADLVVSVSDALAMELRLLGIPATTIHPGVAVPDPAWSRPRGDRARYGFIGRVTSEKGADVFFEIARRLQPAPAHLFGDGPRLAELRARASGLPLRFHGWTDRDAAFEMLDLVVMPSRREGLPLTCLEAGARRRCVVAAAVGGTPEVLRRDELLAKHCLVRAGASAQDYATSIARLLEDHDLRQELADRLHRVVRDSFSIDRHADRMAATLAEVPASGVRRSGGAERGGTVARGLLR